MSHTNTQTHRHTHTLTQAHLRTLIHKIGHLVTTFKFNVMRFRVAKLHKLQPNEQLPLLLLTLTPQQATRNGHRTAHDCMCSSMWSPGVGRKLSLNVFYLSIYLSIYV